MITSGIKTVADIAEFSFMPRCPQCGAVVAYAVAPHPSTTGCKLAGGKVIPTHGASLRTSVEYRVMRSYALYPSLFGRSPWSRWHIFNQLFFVVGNGYQWRHGKLAPVFPQEEDQAGWVGYQRSAFQRKAWTQLFEAGDRAALAEMEARQKAELAEEDIYYYSDGEYERQNAFPQAFYGISEYSPIMKAPKNIAPDWLAAGYDALAMLEAQPGVYKDGAQVDPYRNLDWVERIKAHLDNLKNQS
jgi:hypothetical protein